MWTLKNDTCILAITFNLAVLVVANFWIHYKDIFASAQCTLEVAF